MNPPTWRELGTAVGLFILTFACCTASYTFFMEGTPIQGLAFATSLLSILLAHELGHYFVARAHGFEISVPYFIPMPLPLGTMGAVIDVRSPPKTRQALLEMGAAGPIAGMVVAIVVLMIGLRDLSHPPLGASGTLVPIFRDPLIVKLLGLMVNGEIPDPWVRYGPVAWAGWVGCFVTGLNLVPVGQLDGGHVLNAVSPAAGRKAAVVLPWVLGAIGLAGIPDLLHGMELAEALPAPPFGWFGWLPWLLILYRLRGIDPLTSAPEHPPIPTRGRIVAVVVAILFVLTFLPAPTTMLRIP